VKHTRIMHICEYVYQHDIVSLEQLQKEFGVSMNTIRRDVAQLVAEGKIQKIYGGVCIKENTGRLVPFAQRSAKNPSAKESIAYHAAQLVNDLDTIFLDSGTTTLNMLKHLRERKNVTVITYNVYAIFEALPMENLRVIALPGQLNRETCSFVGNAAIKALESFNIDKAFMAATGLSIQTQVTNSSMGESEIKSKAMQKSLKSYLLLDSSKFDRVSMNTYAQISDFTAVLTEAVPPPAYTGYFKEQGIAFQLCD